MPTSCCTISCTNRYRNGGKIKFCGFPTDAHRRNLSVRAMRRENWRPKEHSRLCSTHFILSNLFVCVCCYIILLFYTEKPSMFMNDPDYVPSVFVFSINKDK